MLIITVANELHATVINCEFVLMFCIVVSCVFSRRTSLPLHAVRQNVLAVHHPKGAREDALSQVCAKVPVAIACGHA